eukprot:COSAG05_NODE_1764_length_4122_cov_3.430524_3_plen_128_part_00
MKDLFMLCTRPFHPDHVSFGFDWAGSSTSDPSDVDKNRVVHNCCYSVGCVCQQKGEVCPVADKVYTADIKGAVNWSSQDSVGGSQWFQKYRSKVKATLQSEAQTSGIRTIEMVSALQIGSLLLQNSP